MIAKQYFMFHSGKFIKIRRTWEYFKSPQISDISSGQLPYYIKHGIWNNWFHGIWVYRTTGEI